MIDTSAFVIHKTLNQNNSSYVYGEISSQSLLSIMNQFSCDNRKFLDIGSGMGTVLFDLSVIENLQLYGIEIDPGRYYSSIMTQESLNQYAIEIMLGDYTELYFGNYDFLYCCNCVFEVEDNDKLFDKIIKEFKGHCFLFAFNKKMLPYYVKHFVINTSWMENTQLYYFYLK